MIPRVRDASSPFSCCCCSPSNIFSRGRVPNRLFCNRPFLDVPSFESYSNENKAGQDICKLGEPKIVSEEASSASLMASGSFCFDRCFLAALPEPPNGTRGSPMTELLDWRVVCRTVLVLSTNVWGDSESAVSLILATTKESLAVFGGCGGCRAE